MVVLTAAYRSLIALLRARIVTESGLVSCLPEKTYLLQTLRSLRPSVAGFSTQSSQVAYPVPPVGEFLP
jgi:hypothetical protein